eukprot:770546-Rhodomonas_salina.2
MELNLGSDRAGDHADHLVEGDHGAVLVYDGAAVDGQQLVALLHPELGPCRHVRKRLHEQPVPVAHAPHHSDAGLRLLPRRRGVACCCGRRRRPGPAV